MRCFHHLLTRGSVSGHQNYVMQTASRFTPLMCAGLVTVAKYNQTKMIYSSLWEGERKWGFDDAGDDVDETDDLFDRMSQRKRFGCHKIEWRHYRMLRECS